MKSKLIFLQLYCSWFHLAYADWQIQLDSEADRVMHMGGNTPRGNFATKDSNSPTRTHVQLLNKNHSKCVGYDRSSSGSTGYSGDSSKQQIQQMIFHLFDSLFAPPPDTSAQDEKQGRMQLNGSKKKSKKAGGIGKMAA